MVVFTCNNCGDALQKPKVAKHLQFQCRKYPDLSCVDCHKDFRGEEYVAHTKCMTENQRYGGQDYQEKPNSNKGERKQNEWINIVQNVLKNDNTLSAPERNFLNQIAHHQNLPRKKAKFMNFIKSSMGNRANWPVVESVWTKMETAFKENKEAVNNGNEIQKENGEQKESIENADAENQNNENTVKENNEESAQKSKKSKKRKQESENGISEEVHCEIENGKNESEEIPKDEQIVEKKKKKKKRNEKENEKEVKPENGVEIKTESGDSEVVNSENVDEKQCEDTPQDEENVEKKKKKKKKKQKGESETEVKTENDVEMKTENENNTEDTVTKAEDENIPNENGERKEKKSKKRKLEVENTSCENKEIESNDTVSMKKKKKRNEEVAQSKNESKKDKFDWKGNIDQILRAKHKQGRLTIAKLQKKIVGRYFHTNSKLTEEEVIEKMNKVLETMDDYKVEDYYVMVPS